MRRSLSSSSPSFVGALGAAAAILVVAVGACGSKDSGGLFNEASGAQGSTSAGAGGATGAGGSGSGTGGTTVSSVDSASSTVASGAGGAPMPVCGDGICNGTETPDTCLKDCPAQCGDGDCNGAETSQTCPKDCGAPTCEHNVCTTGPGLVMGCDACVDTVCNDTPDCCNKDWTGDCVTKANDLCNAQCCGDGQCSGEDCNSCPDDCGTCPPPPTCPHSVCATGGPLNTNDCYDPCVQETCMNDASCCNGSPPMWTGECVDYGKTTCGADPCVEAVCAQNPSCCTADWTQACVQLVVTECMIGCDCSHSICSAGGGKLDPGCNPCATEVCAADPYCCDQDWDGYCVSEVASICGVICN